MLRRLLHWPRFSFNSLRAQLLLWVALPVAVSLLAMSLVEVQGHERAMRHLMQERVDGLAQAAAALIGGRLERNQADLLRLADGLTADSAADGELVALLTASALRYTSFPAGLAVFVAGEGPVASGQAVSWPHDPQVDALIQQVRGSRSPAGIVLGDPGAARLLVQAVPMPVSTTGAGKILAGAVPLDALALPESVQTLSLGPGASLFVEATDGTRLLWLVQNHQEGERVEPGRTVTAVAHVEPVGWHVVLQESWADLVPAVLRFENTILVVVAVAVVVSLLSAYFGLHSIVRPLQRLDRAASQIGWGHFEAIQQPVGGVAEIEDLRLALARMTAQLRQYQQKLQSYIGAMTLGQEEERKRLGRELHDETVQALIALSQQMELVERRLAHDPQEAAQRLRELRPLLSETMAGVRRQIHDLRPPYLEDLGFAPALDMLVRQVAQRHSLIGDFELAGPAQRRLPPDVEISAYRIVQEALRNVVTHTQASWVHVELIFDEEGITLRVEDDGAGFEAPAHVYQLAQEGHYGLLGMQERAQLYGGYLHVESEMGKGTTVVARLVAPLAPADSPEA